MRVSRIKNKKEEKLEKKIDVSLLDPFIKKYKNEKGNLIPLLSMHKSYTAICRKKLFTN